MDRGLPGSSVHGILQARTLQWAVFPSPGDLLYPGIEPWSPDCKQILYHLSHQGSPNAKAWQNSSKTHKQDPVPLLWADAEKLLLTILWGQELCLQRQGPLGLSWPPLDPPEWATNKGQMTDSGARAWTRLWGLRWWPMCPGLLYGSVPPLLRPPMAIQMISSCVISLSIFCLKIKQKKKEL